MGNGGALFIKYQGKDLLPTTSGGLVGLMGASTMNVTYSGESSVIEVIAIADPGNAWEWSIGCPFPPPAAQ